MKRMYYIGYMLCLLLAGCVVGEEADGLLEQRLSDRTLLVYMGGDNDLADETDEKLSALTEEMKCRHIYGNNVRNAKRFTNKRI